MKKVGVLTILLLFLVGCSNTSSEIERGMALRSKLLQAETVTFDAEITADYGDKVYTFTLACQGDSQGNLSFAVTAPESIAGITGRVTNEGGKLTFDDTALQFNLMADDQITPVSAPWILLKTLRSGYLTSACMEGDQLRLTIDDSYEEDALNLDIWLDAEDIPAAADILYDGRRILSLAVTNFTIA